ncbi:MAG: hypothetical protein IJ393_01115 [Clostridia bacterium]|nr:hypothetical protein [Clostridia bacterium]
MAEIKTKSRGFFLGSFHATYGCFKWGETALRRIERLWRYVRNLRLLLGVRYRLAAAIAIEALRLCLKNLQGASPLDP